MVDPDPAASAYRAIIGRKGSGKATFAGGGPALPPSYDLIQRAVSEFVERHPSYRRALAEALEIIGPETVHRPTLIRSATNLRFALSGPPPDDVWGQTLNLTDHRDRLPVYDRFLHSLEALEEQRSDVASIARFSAHVDYATYHFCAVLDAGHAPNLTTYRRKRSVRINTGRSWLSQLAETSFDRWDRCRAILIFDWTPPDEVQPLYRSAFGSLCELTTADTELKRLFDDNPSRARHELARHVDLFAEQLKMTSQLADTLSRESKAADTADNAARLAAVQSGLLARAGDALTLTQAAERLSMSRQALHKRIRSGSALGLMLGETFVIPSIQIVADDSGSRVLPHLKDVLRQFMDSGAGTWSALQYLIDPDPALSGSVPLDLLKAGEVAKVVTAARGYLGLDEG